MNASRIYCHLDHLLWPDSLGLNRPWIFDPNLNIITKLNSKSKAFFCDMRFLLMFIQKSRNYQIRLEWQKSDCGDILKYISQSQLYNYFRHLQFYLVKRVYLFFWLLILFFFHIWTPMSPWTEIDQFYCRDCVFRAFIEKALNEIRFSSHFSPFRPLYNYRISSGILQFGFYFD